MPSNDPEYTRKYYERHKERLKKVRRRWYEKNKEKVKQRSHDYYHNIVKPEREKKGQRPKRRKVERTTD